VSTETDSWMAEYKRDREIHCPHCDALQANDDQQYPVTYWAEDGPQEMACDDCEKTFFAEEHVSRTYTAAKTVEELNDL